MAVVGFDGNTRRRVTPAQYLLRPDGHVGYRAGGTDLTGLARYLTQWLPGRRAGPRPTG